MPTLAVQGGSGGGGGNSGSYDGGGGGAGGYGAVITGAGALGTLGVDVTGGNGGAGGTGSNGGGGGSGGLGLLIHGSATSFSNTATISGGAGGNGGDSVNFGFPPPAAGGSGGAGGVGVSASGILLTNSGTITGGAGGTGGAGAPGLEGAAGAGGAGVVGADLTIVNSGSISGGLSGDGVRANAITFTGGTNTYQLQAGGTTTGNVVVAGGTGTLQLGGTTNSTFDVSAIGAASNGFQGFTSYQKTGSSTWTLTGSTSATTSWQIDQGTLSISSDANLGAAAGTLTLDGGTLQTTASMTSARGVTLGTGGGTVDTTGTLTLGGILSGDGGLTKTGTGTLVLSGTNTYSGGTTVSGGTLNISSDANLGATGGLILAGGTLQLASSLDLASNRTVTLGTGGGTIETNGATTIAQGIGENVAGAALTKSGFGTLTLTGASTYTGGTTVTQGNLNIGNGGTSGSILGDVVLGTATNLNFSRSDDYTFSGNISGQGAVGAGGTGTLTLTGNNTYTGATSLSGTLNLGSAGAIGTTGTIFFFFGGTLQYSAANQTDYSSRFATNDGQFYSVDTNGQNVTWASNLTSSLGSLTKRGAGNLTLSGTNTYDQGTTISAGTVTVANNSAFGTGTVTMAEGTTLAFANTGNYTIANNFVINGDPIFDTPTGTTQTISGVISDGGTPGVVEKIGDGTLVLSGANTYSGGTVISAGTLEVGTGGTLGTGAVVDDAALVFNASGDLSVANAISGSGTLQQLGTGTTTLTGALTYTGLTTVSSGELVLGDATHSVTLPGDATVASGAGLALVNGSLGTGTITISSGAGLVVGASGTTATAGSATILNSGNTAFQFAGSAGTATITNTGIVDFTDTATAASAQITNNGSGLLQFRGNSTAGDATITTNSGAPGGVLDGAGTIFGGSASGGTSRQIVNAGGLLDITAAAAGVTIGSLEGAGVVAVGGKILTVGANDLSTTFSGVIQNLGSQLGSGGLAGGLTKIGTGTLTLSGTNTYVGATTVSAGALIVDGSIAPSSSLTVDAGALVGGSGTLPSATVSGTLSPGTGTGIGTLAVAGDLSFAAGSTYRVDVSPASADLTNVTGTATLAGTVSALFQAGTYVTRNYVILSAAGGLGGTTFAGLATTDLPAGFVSSLSYTTTDVLLTLSATLGLGQDLNGNQQAVATGLNNAFNAGAALPAAFLPLYGLTGAPLGAALSQLSGEPATGAIQAGLQATGSFLGLMLDPFVAGRGAADGAVPGGPALAFAGDTSALPAQAARAYAAAMPGVYTKAPPAALAAPRWTVWASAFGGRATIDGDAAVGSHDLDSRVWGVAAGADYRLSAETLLGFALAGGQTKWSTGGLGSGASDVFQAGLYGSHRFGPGFVSAALAYAWHDATTTRSITAVGPETLEGRLHPQVLAARLETGWRFGGPTLGLTPYAAGQVQAFRMPGFAETATFGPGTFALAYAEETVTAPRSEIGAWADTRFLTGWGELILRGRAAWAHDFQTDRRLTPTFQTLPGASFVVTGATADADLALVSAAAEWRLAGGVAVIAKVDGAFGDTSRTLAGTGTLRVTW
ncbi:autotransporter domain-containing protein [Rhodoplanes sp. TEM]|uniref:Autotransporter domain-containing protein n=1 Tax=Rhodoplanes tepidamans TaxID=200616 RepID=A0ABT5JIR7_RHOTP|nr:MULTISPECIES: autotransporter domain-containing protein [Rhodoplanes]MDC7789273.1 autotransporter domain-containing protein [Rhodoplanes tepidamans]MDC7987052.1 autotransporter domain-containing protein [Rhodoplanes sp. TEM]MDQ0355537.1 autotransporter-associated beta strand protein [Rhodoplanes tepidamans]